jgi:allantoinase
VFSNYELYLPMIDRPVIRWPENAPLALWISPNIEHYEYLPPRNEASDPWPRTPHPDVMNYAYRDYGNRVGFWRMLEVLDQHKILPTASLNVAVLDHFPAIRDAMVKRDWAFMSHGTYNTRHLYGATEEQERALYQDCIDTIKRHTGKQLKGMLSPAITNTARTPDLMAEAGLIYTADWFWDDQPMPLHVGQGRLITVPYTIELNDSLMFQHTYYRQGYEGEYFVQICKDQFDVLYREGQQSGRVMCIALHPFLIGQPHRVRYLDEILSYILSHDGVWQTTADDIAEYFYANYYEQFLAHVRTLELAGRLGRAFSGRVETSPGVNG